MEFEPEYEVILRDNFLGDADNLLSAAENYGTDHNYSAKRHSETVLAKMHAITMGRLVIKPPLTFKEQYQISTRALEIIENAQSSTES